MNDPTPGATGDPRAVRSILPLALRLARQWWPQLAALAAACGVVAATVTGALGVGDALERGLKSLALARLGRIDVAVLSDDFFRAALAVELGLSMGPDDAGFPSARLVPALVIEAAVESAATADGQRRGGRATVLACDDPAALGFALPPELLEPDAVAVNAVLAESLGLRVGDPLVLRFADRSSVPADSPLGRRTGGSSGKRLRVGQVLPRDGLGQFALRPAQVTQPLVVASLSTVQRILRQGDVANAIFAIPDRPAADAAALESLSTRFRQRLRPTLEDYGLALEAAAGGAPGSAPLRLTSRRLILSAEADRAAGEVLAPRGGQPTLVFLANALTTVGPAGETPATIPYSTVLGVASMSLPSGALVGADGGVLPLPGPEEIVIDRWMADDLAAQGSRIAVGDPLEVRFFLPEALHGRIEETSHVLRVSGIAEMRAAAIAQDLVPEVEGVSDEKSIADWDPPFPFDAQRVRTTPPNDADDRYWKEHGTTPKAFVSLETARRLAGSRFGRSTAWHLPRPATGTEEIRQSLAAAIRPEPMGLRVVPLRIQALAAARGSTPFGSLFLALSSFVVASGLLLEWLLFKLLVAARRRDVGILAAVGWPPARIAGLLTIVGGIAAVGGVAIGTLLGPPWSAILLRALGASWNASVANGSSQVFGTATPAFFAIWPGALASAAVSLVAIAAAARRAGRVPPLSLLRGSGDDASATRPGTSVGTRTVAVALVMLAAAVASGWLARAAEPQQAVLLFFLSGAAALAGLLAIVRLWLGRSGRTRQFPLKTLFGLAWRGITQRPARAFSVVAIVALAEFLIVAVSSFAIVPVDQPGDRRSPTGGWTHIATFGTPTGIDPTDPAQRDGLGLTAEEQASLADCTIARLRSNTGDDASCTNLYAPGQPNVLGVGPAFIDRGGFRFVAHTPLDAGETNPWTLLERDQSAAGTPPIPAIIDQATAQWALKLGGVGARFTIPNADQSDGGADLVLEIVGLLEPGILQGSVVVAEREFERMFPRRSGYSVALVEAPAALLPAGLPPTAGRPDRVAAAVAAAWADAAVSVQTAGARFATLSAVQNTFLAGFQALGTLGLLLGTAGLAAVQFERVLESRGQFSLLRAIGFGAGRIRNLIVIETLLMVGLGLAVGAVAGVIASLPSLASGRAAVPVGWIGTTCGLTLVVGLVAGLAAARRATRLALREALQPD